MSRHFTSETTSNPLRSDLRVYESDKREKEDKPWRSSARDDALKSCLLFNSRLGQNHQAPGMLRPKSTVCVHP
jgi:hypothetical protein